MRSSPSLIKVSVLVPAIALLSSCTSVGVANTEPTMKIAAPSPIVSFGPTVSPSPTEPPRAASPAVSRTITPQPGGPDLKAPLENNPPETTPSPSGTVPSATMGVFLDIRGTLIEVSVERGASAYDLLVAAQKQGHITFAGRSFSGVGFFVEEINGLRQDPQQGMYWIYSVNGEKAHVGVTSYILHGGDQVRFTYEAANE